MVAGRTAPEARGTFCTRAAAFGYAVLLCIFATLSLDAEIRADASRLWTTAALPAFALADIGGTNASLEAARGHVVLVHFFATWCEPCREELPALNRLAARGAGDVKILAIAVADVDQRVRRFAQTAAVRFPILLDRDRALAKAWKVATLPTTFVLDADLRPRLVVEADFAWDKIDPAELGSLSAADAGTLVSIGNDRNQHVGEDYNALR